MNIFIPYYSREESVPIVVDSLKKVFEIEGHKVTIEAIKPKIKLKERREQKYSKLKSIEFENTDFNVSGFDLTVIGTHVWSFSPSPVITAYLKKLENAQKKDFALFIVCILPGNVIKKMSNILSTQGANVLATHSIQSIFKLNEKKLVAVKAFAHEILEKKKNKKEEAKSKKTKRKKSKEK